MDDGAERVREEKGPMGDMAENEAVRCENVVRNYRRGPLEVAALRGVSLSVPQGGFVALAGPSGSGKTTLLNLMGGLDVPDEGRVLVEGRDPSAMSARALAELRLRRIGFVFQSYNLIPVLSALENVEYVMLLQGLPKEERRRRATEVLDEVGLSGMHGRRPSELSGGQQQRVAVARAIASEPAIVLADEPTANLDSGTGAGLLSLMADMNRRRGVTFVFSTHDAQVMAHARTLVFLRDGRVEDIRERG